MTMSRRKFLKTGSAAAVTAILGGSIPWAKIDLGGADVFLAAAEGSERFPLHAFCGTGDHLWVRDKEPVDSRAAVEAMVEWMSRTYGINRMYWRGAGEQLWDRSFKFGKETPLQYDWSAVWKHRLFEEESLNEAAVSAAKRRGMEIYAYAGLFDYGVQPDVGIIGPYLFEHKLRMEHPEWCMTDRWGERRCPGPLSFGFPEARRLLVQEYVDYVTELGFDGINFYTYVENTGMRYLNEFGFEQPVADEFNKRYPTVDLRRDPLTDEQRLHWHQCRGKFVTDFIRELHAALAAGGKRLSVILDSANPDYVQPWWGKPAPGTGMIRLDWKRWIAEGIVDELWTQLGSPSDQTATLDRLLAESEGTPVKLTVRAVNPFDPVWEPYKQAGVTPIAVITSPQNGIERLTLQPIGSDSLNSEDWMIRAQALADIAKRGSADEAEIKVIARLAASDSHVLVRQRAMRALGKLRATEKAEIVEKGLRDRESCVRIAAADALAGANGPRSLMKLLKALEQNDGFQFKLACIDTLTALGEAARRDVLQGLRSRSATVREVCARCLGASAEADAQELLVGIMMNVHEEETVRYWAIDSLRRLCAVGAATDRDACVAGYLRLAEEERSTTVQLHAVRSIGLLANMLTSVQRNEAYDILTALFRQYGDGCTRTDAAFGWRLVGNALTALGSTGRSRLELMRREQQNRWLAWLAYEALYVPLRVQDMQLVQESEAIRIHDTYAPPFPGYRRW